MVLFIWMAQNLVCDEFLFSDGRAALSGSVVEAGHVFRVPIKVLLSPACALHRFFLILVRAVFGLRVGLFWTVQHVLWRGVVQMLRCVIAWVGHVSHISASEKLLLYLVATIITNSSIADPASRIAWINAHLSLPGITAVRAWILEEVIAFKKLLQVLVIVLA